jgi:hypothetical protein
MPEHQRGREPNKLQGKEQQEKRLPDFTWHVAVLGDLPSDELHRRLTTVLATGE